MPIYIRSEDRRVTGSWLVEAGEVGFEYQNPFPGWSSERSALHTQMNHFSKSPMFLRHTTQDNVREGK